MASVNISIRKDVYDEIVRRKGQESFSEFLERLLQRPTRLSDYAGILDEATARELRANIARNRALDLGQAKRRRR